MFCDGGANVWRRLTCVPATSKSLNVRVTVTHSFVSESSWPRQLPSA